MFNWLIPSLMMFRYVKIKEVKGHTLAQYNHCLWYADAGTVLRGSTNPGAMDMPMVNSHIPYDERTVVKMRYPS